MKHDNPALFARPGDSTPLISLTPAQALAARKQAPEQDPPIKMLPVLFENDPQRQAFEVWWRRTNATPLYMNEDGTYTRSAINEAWDAWQACSEGVEAVVDALTLALPYVEDAEKDPAYKPGAVKRVTAQMRAALAKWEAR